MELLLRYKKFIFLIGFVLIIFFVVSRFLKKDPVETKVEEKVTNNYSYTDGLTKTDTLEKYGFHAVENYVVKEVGEVRRTPNFAAYNTIHKLKFGTKIYTKEVDSTSTIEIDPELLAKESKNEYVAVYASKPIVFSDIPVGYMAKTEFVRKSDFKNYKPEPIKPKKVEFDAGIKATIEDTYIINDDGFKLSEDFKRYNQSVVYGDYNNDNSKDFSVVLDNPEGTKSSILIFFFNAEKNLYDLMLKKTYEGLISIKSIKKNSSIMVNSETTSFPIDGVLCTIPNATGYFHIYNTDNNSFMILPQ